MEACIYKYGLSYPTCITYVHMYSLSGVFEFKVTEFSAQEEDADIDDDPVLDQGTGD